MRMTSSAFPRPQESLREQNPTALQPRGRGISSLLFGIGELWSIVFIAVEMAQEAGRSFGSLFRTAALRKAYKFLVFATHGDLNSTAIFFVLLHSYLKRIFGLF
jgi:hypothetical protein